MNLDLPRDAVVTPPFMPPALEGSVGSKRPMPFDIYPGDTCRFDDDEVVFKGVLGADGHLEFLQMPHGGLYRHQDLMTGTAVVPDGSLILDLVRQGRFGLVRRGPNAPAGNAALPDYDHDQIVGRDKKARLRRFVVTELIKLGARCSDPNISAKLTSIWSDDVEKEWGEKPIPGTVRRWLARAIRLEHVRLVDMMSLTGRVARRPSLRRLDPALRDFVKEGARHYYTARGITASDAEAKVDDLRVKENQRREEAGGIEPPLPAVSRSTVRRAIKAIQCRDTLTEKCGKEWVQRRYRISGKGLHTVRLLQTALVDDKLFDGVFVLDAERRLPVGRPWLCLIVDVHTRCILGWHIGFQAPTVHSAVECFKNACRPKLIRPDRRARYPVLESIFGLPSELLSDNGSNYASPSFQDALADVGTTLRLAAVKSPTHKAILERLFRTLDTFLAAKLPGATLDPALARELGFDSEKEACLTLGELNELMEEFVFAYHVTVHSGIEMQPALAWDLSRRSHPINLLRNAERLDQLLGEPDFRRLTRNGFRKHGLWWRDPDICGRLADDLAGMEPAKDRITGTFSATVKIKINTANLGKAQVWNPRSRCYVSVPSATPRYCDGLSLFQHRQVRDWARRESMAFNTEEERLAARHALNERIKELDPDVAVRERRAMARMLGSSFVQREQDVVPVETIEERHDSKGASIGVVDSAAERTDGGALFDRPAPKVIKTAAESPLNPAIGDADADGPDDDDYDPDDLWDHEDDLGAEALS